MELKEQVIEATIQEFNEKGIKFTMEDLAKRLGMSKRTIYTVVEDKETLFLDAVDYVFAAIKESERTILEEDDLGTIDKIKGILIVLPEKYHTIDFRRIYELKERYPNIFAKVEEKIENNWEPTFHLLEQAMEQNIIKKINLHLFRAMISGTIEQLLEGRTLVNSENSYNQELEEMIDMIMYGIVNKEKGV